MDAILPVVLPVLAGLLLRRFGAVLAGLGLAAWAVWIGIDGNDLGDVGLAAAFGLVGGALLGGAGAMLRTQSIRRRSPDGGSTW